MYTRRNRCFSLSLSLSLYIYVCMYIHMCTHMHVHICTQVFIGVYVGWSIGLMLTCVARLYCIICRHCRCEALPRGPDRCILYVFVCVARRDGATTSPYAVGADACHRRRPTERKDSVGMDLRTLSLVLGETVCWKLLGL